MQSMPIRGLDRYSHRFDYRMLKGKVEKSQSSMSLTHWHRDGGVTGFGNLNVPPPNIHDKEIFLVKLQISLFKYTDEAHFLIYYDRRKSFRGRRDDRDLFTRGDIVGITG